MSPCRLGSTSTVALLIKRNPASIGLGFQNHIPDDFCSVFTRSFRWFTRLDRASTMDDWRRAQRMPAAPAPMPAPVPAPQCQAYLAPPKIVDEYGGTKNILTTTNCFFKGAFGTVLQKDPKHGVVFSIITYQTVWLSNCVLDQVSWQPWEPPEDHPNCICGSWRTADLIGVYNGIQHVGWF